MTLGADEARRLEEAFDAAQARTRAPIMCVLASASSDYAILPLAACGLATLATPWPLLMFTSLSAERVFIVQLLVCLVALAIVSVRPLRILSTPKRVRRANAHRAAVVQFSVRGLDHAAERNGVLLYVSLAERYARVIADSGASQVIGAREWQGLIDALTSDLAAKGTSPALCAAAERCADLLSRPFPPEGAAPPRGQRFHAL
jgi:putative membrane protein